MPAHSSTSQRESRQPQRGSTSHRGRGGGTAGSRVGSLRSQGKRPRLAEASSEEGEDDDEDLRYPYRGRTHHTRGNDSEHEEDTTHPDEDHDSDLDANESTLKHKQIKKPAVVLPTMLNYHKLGLEWGEARAEEVLAQQPYTKNRPSPAGLFEAQALQAQYDLDKTMLSLAIGVSRNTLDEALLEGPLAREPNSYTNHQTYSVAATETPMPPKGVSDGFSQRNKLVGNVWSAYDEDEHAIFTPRLFERLALASAEAFALTDQPASLPIAPDDGTNPILLEALSPEDLDRYLPVFQRVVNVKKVTADIRHGRLCRHSGRAQANKLDKIMRAEISKIVRQLQILHGHFRLQFHLLVASWNPGANIKRALFQEEHTSCDRWVEECQKTHLLECFAHESTKAPISKLKKKNSGPSPGAIHQAAKRAELTNALNQLVAKHLPGPHRGRADAHPKSANMDVALQNRLFRGTIKLQVYRGPGCKVTNEMLAKGAGATTLDQINDWLIDIESEKYDVVLAPSSGSDLDSDERS